MSRFGKHNRKHAGWLKLTALIASAALLAGCGSSAKVDGTSAAASNSGEAVSEATASSASADKDSSSDTTIRVAVQSSTYIPFLTQELGYFDDAFSNKTKVKLVNFSAGPAMIEAVNSGDIDIAFLGDLPAFSGLVNGGEYKIIGKYSEDSAKALVVRKDANIHSLADLKGHTYAVQFGSNVQPLAELYLEKAGLKDSDVQYTNLSFGDINSSLISGDVDAAVQNEPNLSKLLNSSDQVEVLKTSEGYMNFVGPIIARNDFLDKNGKAASEFLSALQKASEWSHKNPKDAVAKIAKATELDTADVQSLFDKQNNNPYLTDGQIQTLVQSAANDYKYNLLNEKLDVEKYIDLSYLKNAGITGEDPDTPDATSTEE